MTFIAEIKFTTREIDVISCIVNARGIKKIAGLLMLSPRTVEGHIQNIMLKLRCNSQDSIIDFVEKSEEFKLIKEHYLNLLINTAFEQQLKRIYYLTKNSKTFLYIKDPCQKDILQTLKKHLKIAGITLLKNDDEDIQSSKNSSYDYELRILSPENSEQILLEESFKKTPNTFFLCLENANNKLIAPKFLDKNIEVIDFSISAEYFHNVFKVLEKLLVNIDCNKFIVDFEQLRFNIINSKTDTIEISERFKKNMKA